MSSTGPTGARGRTVTEQELAEAIKAGGDQYDYSRCRWAGATHAEALEAHVAGASLRWYHFCRRAGATHPEAIALRLCEAGPEPHEAAELAVPALRAACGSAPTRELGETIATLAQDWAGTADELAATAVALLSTRAS